MGVNGMSDQFSQSAFGDLLARFSERALLILIFPIILIVALRIPVGREQKNPFESGPRRWWWRHPWR